MLSINIKKNINNGYLFATQKIIPLYSDLAELLIEYLEPCADYRPFKCAHKKAHCHCGYQFRFHENFFKCGEVYILENFCPVCGSPNCHPTLKPELTNELYPPVLLRTTHLHCPSCNKTAESYSHKFCSDCNSYLF